MSTPLRTPLLRALALCLTLLSLAACDSGDPEEERIGLTGQWSGVLTSRSDSTQAFPIVMTLNDDVSNVTGAGSIEVPGETIDFTVVGGLYSAPSLSLSLVYDRGPGSISGNVSSERDFIDATLSGPGLANGEVEFALVLQRAE